MSQAKKPKNKGENQRITGEKGGESRPSAHLSTRLRPRKTPRQERARQTVEAILQASAQVFARHGYARTTTNKIAVRAGVSVGSLYQYFPNKDAILAGLMDKHMEQVQAVVREALADLANPDFSLLEGFRGLFTRLVAIHQADPDLTRALSEENLHLATADPSHKEREKKYVEITARILEARPDVRPGDLITISHMLVQTTETLSRWMVHDAPEELDLATATEEAALMLARFVSAEGVAAEKRKPAPGAATIPPESQAPAAPRTPAPAQPPPAPAAPAAAGLQIGGTCHPRKAWSVESRSEDRR